MQRLLLSVLLAGALTGPAFAQAPAAGDSKGAPASGPPGAATPAPAGNTPAAPGEKGASEEELRRALDLPFAARDLRARGVPEAEVRSSLGAMKDAKVPAGEAAEVTEAAAAEVGEHGPVDNFGAFVQAQLAAGLRGKELSAAIKAEHAAHGKGKGEVGTPGAEGQGPDGDHGGGKPEGAEHGGGADKAPGREGAEHGHGANAGGDKAPARNPESMGRDRAPGRPESTDKPAGGGGMSRERGDKNDKGGGK